jgi:hypothetical protein
MARARPCSLCIVLLVFAQILPAKGKSFLRQQEVQTREEVEASLLAELSGTFRPSATKDHIIALEAALQPLYASVPQEKDGSLNHQVVRYVLHRFFAQRGWFVRGLEPGNSDKAGVENLQEWVPNFLQGFLEQLAGGRGTSLRELAVLAATLEDLIHKESISRLKLTYNALQLPMDEKVSAEKVPEVLEIFMMVYQLGGNFTAKDPAFVRRAHNAFVKQVKDWAEIQEWMLSIHQTIHPGKSAPDDVVSFDELERVVEEIGAKYGDYNKKECGSLKAQLLEVEAEKAGRIRLADFYKKGLTGVFEFNEKIDYLRVLGAIDESDPKEPHVIIPNYVSSRPNCLASSGFYVICCQNQCEDLMGRLENVIGAEMAAPEKVLEVVSTLSTDTVLAGRNLADSAAGRTMIQRLYSMAQSNGGKVPLHGRLFAQWLHHAFPRECPFPHEGGTNPQTPDEWMKSNGAETTKASTDEIMEHVSRVDGEKPLGEAARQYQGLVENDLPWSEAEEMFGVRSSRADSQTSRPLRTLAVFAVMGSIFSGLVWTVRQDAHKLKGGLLDRPMELDKATGKMN